MPRFARVTPEHLALIEDGLSKPTRLYLHALLWSKPADGLNGWAAKRFEEWRAECGLEGVEASKFRSSDFTLVQAMEWLGTSSRRVAGDAIAGTVSSGLLFRAAAGMKGRASLYLIAPLPSLEFVPRITNDLGTKEEDDSSPESANTSPNKGACVPSSFGEVGTTNKSLHKITAETQAACADRAAPPVKAGDLCPYCSELGTTAHVVGIEKIIENPRAELRGELRCRSCYTSWDKEGNFKRFSEQHGYMLSYHFNPDGTPKAREVVPA